MIVAFTLALIVQGGPFTAATEAQVARGPFTEAVAKSDTTPPKPETPAPKPAVAPATPPKPAYTTAVCQCRGANESVCLCRRSGVQCRCSAGVGSVWWVDQFNRLAGKTGQYVNPNGGYTLQAQHAGAAANCPACARGR